MGSLYLGSETVTSYTATTLIDSEHHADLRDGLIMLESQVLGVHNASIYICVDSAPGLVALEKDPVLVSNHIKLV